MRRVPDVLAPALSVVFVGISFESKLAWFVRLREFVAAGQEPRASR